MRRSSLWWLVVSGCFVLAATASPQSLAELAQKEKARRAEIAKTGETVEVVDAHALRTLDATTFTAIEVSGALSQISSAEPAELGRPPLENPNRVGEPATGPSSTGNRQGAVERGWSSGSDHPPGERGWSRTESEYPTDGRGWTRGGDNPPGERGWSQRPAADRGYTNGGEYSPSGRGWTRGGENPPSGRGWSQRPSSR